jgi:hypothetical protein
VSEYVPKPPIYVWGLEPKSKATSAPGRVRAEVASAELLARVHRMQEQDGCPPGFSVWHAEGEGWAIRDPKGGAWPPEHLTREAAVAAAWEMATPDEAA